MGQYRPIRRLTSAASDPPFGASGLPLVAIIDPSGASLVDQLQLAGESPLVRHGLDVSSLDGAQFQLASLVVLCVRRPLFHGVWFKVQDCVCSLSRLKPTPFAIIADVFGVEDVIRCLQEGARGCIPADLPPSVILQALELIIAGAVFVPPETTARIGRDLNEYKSS